MSDETKKCDRPLVSFVLPAYKRRYLHESIASILSQTFKNFEVIVVDDCSPDDLKSIVDEFRDERLSYHRNETNIGGKNLVAAWTHALRYATAEWCVVASDDDIYEPRFLEVLVGLTEKYPEVDLFRARPGMIDSDSKRLSVSVGRMECESILEFAYARNVMRMQQTLPDFMFRLSALKRVGGFVDFPCAIYSDDATWYKIAKENGCVSSAEVLFWWRVSGINVSTRTDNLIGKLEAAARFEVWMCDFLSSLKPLSDQDAIMLSRLRKLNHAEVVLHMRLDMRCAGFINWWRGVLSPFVRWPDKMRMVYDRYMKLVDVANWR